MNFRKEEFGWRNARFDGNAAVVLEPVRLWNHISTSSADPARDRCDIPPGAVTDADAERET